MTTATKRNEPMQRSGPAPATATDSVDDLRARIDEIDRALLNLLDERCRTARRLGAAKVAADRSLVDHPREARVVRRAARAARSAGLDEEIVRRVYWSVIELSRRAQDGIASARDTDARDGDG